MEEKERHSSEGYIVGGAIMRDAVLGRPMMMMVMRRMLHLWLDVGISDLAWDGREALCTRAMTRKRGLKAEGCEHSYICDWLRRAMRQYM